MEPYMDAPVVEAHEDQYVDHTLAQLQQSIQKAQNDAKQQLSNVEQQQSEAISTSISLSPSMHTAADVDSATDTADSPHLQDTEDVTTPAAAADEEDATASPVAIDNAEASAADGLQEAVAVAASPAGPASVASDKSCEEESDWQMVSPHGSVRVPSSGRYSFEYQGITSPTLEVASDSGCSGSDTTSTPKDDLAESILGNSVLMAAASSASAGHLAAAAAATELHHGSDDGMEAVRAASAVSSEGGLDGLAAANPQQLVTTGSGNSTEAAAIAPAVAADEAARAAKAEITELVQQSVDASMDAEVLTGLGLLGSGLREWLMESLAALVQTGRVSHATCVSYTESIQRSLHLMAKQGGVAAAAVGAATNWRVVLSSAAAVVCLAMWLKTRNEAAALRAMLRRRDHELSKLVMRLVSLQELLNQGQALPITRYVRYEGTSTVAASYM